LKGASTSNSGNNSAKLIGTNANGHFLPVLAHFTAAAIDHKLFAQHLSSSLRGFSLCSGGINCSANGDDQTFEKSISTLTGPSNPLMARAQSTFLHQRSTTK